MQHGGLFNTCSACTDCWPGFLARCFWTENIVYRFTGTETYRLTVRPGQKNIVLQFYWDEERREKNYVLNIPYN